MDFLDPVDILSKIPDTFSGETGIESKKWQERKEALQLLLDLLTANPKLEPKSNYGEIVNQLNRLLGKDANINVQALAAKCICGLATGLQKKFGPHAPTVFPTILDKFKEKKPLLRDPLLECVDAVFVSTNLEALEEPLLAFMDNKNPQIKSQTDMFLYRAFKKLNAQTMPKKTLKALVPVLIKHTGDADTEVRNGGSAALGSAVRVVGQTAANSLLKEISEDKMKMAKITEYCEKATSEVAEEQAASAAASGVVASSGASDQPEEEEESAAVETVSTTAPVVEQDPFEFMDPFDLIGKLPASFYSEENGTLSKKWMERKDALQAVLDMMTANPKLDPKGNYGELVSTLTRLLGKDANINVAALAAKCIDGLAYGLRKKFATHVTTVIGVILEKFKEKKPTLKEPLIECIDKVATTVDLEVMEEALLAAMDTKNPQIKAQCDMFLYRIFKKLNPQTMPKKTLKALTPLLVKHTGESDAEVRDASYAALGAAMRVIGEKAITQLCADIAEDKLKMTKIKEFCQKATEEAGPVVTAAPVPPPAAKKAEEKKPAAKAPGGKPPAGGAKKPPSRPRTPEEEPNEEEEETQRPPSRNGKPAASAKKAPPKKEEEEPEEKKSTEQLVENGDKAQRAKDEATLKVLKWNFTTPTDEHIQQLNTQFSQYAKPGLMGMLFNKDFKQHLKAIEELTKIGQSNPLVLTTNSDLILKWCTLRFFETNPAALIKTLELSLRVVQCCRQEEDPMNTSEVDSFFPYLVMKSGEQKDNMRAVVREIIDEMTEMSGPFKLAPMIIDGLKTKNARQRTELLMVLEKYIAGGALGQLKALGIIKSVAPCVGDADKNVRNAAINAMVAAYRVDGEGVWKQAGKMADKDKAMVDERIKRAGAVPGSAVPAVQATPGKGARIVKPETGTVVRGRRQSTSRPSSRPTSPYEEDGAHNSTFVAGRNARNNDTFAVISPETEGNKGNETRGLFNLDDQFLSPNEVQLRARRHQVIGESSNLLSNAEGKLTRPIDPAVNFRRGGGEGGEFKRASSVSSISSVDTIDQLDKAINDISSTQFQVSHDAIAQLVYIGQFPEQISLLHERVDLILSMCSMQLECSLKSAPFTNIENTGILVRNIYNFISQTFMSTNHNVIQHVSTRVVENILSEMINSISSPTLSSYTDFPMLGRAANVVLMRFAKLCRPAVFFEAVINNMITFTPKKVAEWDMLLRILHRFVQSTTDTNYVARCDLRQFFMAANSFFVHMFTQNAQSKQSLEEAKDHMNVAIENIVNVVREKALDSIRRIPHPHPKLIEYVSKILSKVKDTPAPEVPQNLPGQVEDPPTVFSMEKLWSLLHFVGSDYTQLSRSIPPLAEFYKQNPIQQGVIKGKIEQYLHGKTVYSFMINYLNNGENTVWPPQELLEAYNSTRDVMLPFMGSVPIWGERMNPLVKTNGNDGREDAMMTISMMSNMSDLPTVPNHIGSLPEPIQATPVIKKPIRRSMMAKPELDSLKDRLARARGADTNGN